jgi:Fe2+ transport system protein FeoA
MEPVRRGSERRENYEHGHVLIDERLYSLGFVEGKQVQIKLLRRN